MLLARRARPEYVNPVASSDSNDTATSPPRDVAEMVKRAREFLAKKGIEEARLEAELLVSHALGLDRLKLFLRFDQPVSSEEIQRARELLVRRGKREPTAYVTGVQHFYGRAFRVGKGCLIPRPETELLVDRVRELAKARSIARIADFGTGSGALAVTLALEVEGSDVLAVDASSDALAHARANAEALGARVTFVEGDGFTALERRTRETAPFDVVVANPPYVATDERAELAPEVRDHEPSIALFAPAGDPDHFARRLVAERARWLAQDGVLLVELGHRQSATLRPWLAERSVAARFHRDLDGHERVLEVTGAST